MTQGPCRPNGIRRVSWRPSWCTAEASQPLAGGFGLETADLVIVGPGVSSAAASNASAETTPVVCLPETVRSEPARSALDEMVRRTADDVASSGRTVIWIESTERSDPGAESSDEAPLSRRQLARKCVLVARPRHQAVALVERLRSLGATVVSLPAIVIRPPTDLEPVDSAITRVEGYDWIVFSSVNGVRFFLDRTRVLRGSVAAIKQAKLAAIGPGTAEALGEFGLQADLIPGEYRAEALADMLARDAAGKRFLLARASRGREILAQRLSAAGGHVEQVVVYRSEDLVPDESRLRPVVELMDKERMDWIVVSSSAIARSLARLFGPLLDKTRLASISPVTSQVLEELGHRPSAEATVYTLDGMVEAILAAGANR